MLLAQAGHSPSRPEFACRRAYLLGIEQLGKLMVWQTTGEIAQTLHQCGGSETMPANRRADDLMACGHPTAPQDGHRSRAGCGRGERNLLNDRAQEPLAISHRGRGSLPDGGHIQAELANRFLLFWGQGHQRGFWATAYSRSRRLWASKASFQRFWRSRATSRFSGSPASYWRPASRPAQRA